MAKRTRARAAPRKTETLTLNLPRHLRTVIEEAARMGGMTPAQIVNAILALRLVIELRAKTQVKP